MRSFRSRVVRREVAPEWRADLDGLPFVVLDIETTGLDPNRDRIIEIALVDASGPILESVVDPREPRELGTLHGLTAADLAGAPSFAELLPEIRKRLAGRIIVAHWADFDLQFVTSEAARAGRPLPPLPYLCTAALADSLRLGHESRSLAYACRRYGVELQHPHEAAVDAGAACELFLGYAARARADSWRLSTLPNPIRVDSSAPQSWCRRPLGAVPASAAAAASAPARVRRRSYAA